METAMTKMWYLKNIDVFSHLRKDELDMVNKNTEMRDIKKGEILYIQGTYDKNMYILKKGAVKITKLTPHGKTIILDIFKGGTIFGEMSLVEPQERDETAEVIEDGLICTIPLTKFNELSQIVPGLSIKITKMMGLRRFKIENKLLDLVYCGVEQRLAKTILNLLHDFGVPYDNGYKVQLKLTHQDLSDLIASTRETVTATLNKFKEDNIIDFEGKRIIVKSIAELTSLSL